MENHHLPTYGQGYVLYCSQTCRNRNPRLLRLRGRLRVTTSRLALSGTRDSRLGHAACCMGGIAADKTLPHAHKSRLSRKSCAMFPSALSITGRTKRKTVLIYCMPSSIAELTGGRVGPEVVFSDTRAWRCSPDRGRLGNEPRESSKSGESWSYVPLICMTRSLPRRSLKAKAGDEERQLAMR